MTGEREPNRRYYTTDGLPLVSASSRKGIVAATSVRDNDDSEDESFYGPEGSSYFENVNVELAVLDIVGAQNEGYLDPLMKGSLQMGSRITQRVLARAHEEQTQLILQRVGGSDYMGSSLTSLDQVIDFLDRRLGNDGDYVLPALKKVLMDYDEACSARRFLDAARKQTRMSDATFDKLLKVYNLDQFSPELRPKAEGLVVKLFELGKAATKIKSNRKGPGINPLVPLLANVYRSIADIFNAQPREETPAYAHRAVPLVTSKHIEKVAREIGRLKSKDAITLDEIHLTTLGISGMPDDPARNPLLRDATRELVRRLTTGKKSKEYWHGVGAGAVVANHLIATASMNSPDYLTPPIIALAQKDTPHTFLEAAQGLERLGFGSTGYVRLLRNAHNEEEAIARSKKDYPQSIEEVVGELQTNRTVRPDQKKALEQFGVQYDRALGEVARVKHELGQITQERDVVTHQLQHERDYSRLVEEELLETHRTLNAQPEQPSQSSIERRSLFKGPQKLPQEEEEQIVYAMDRIVDVLGVAD